MTRWFFTTLMFLLLKAFTKTLYLFQPLLYVGSQGTEQVENSKLLLKLLSPTIIY